MLTLPIIREIVNQYLAHPRRYNAGFEQLLFMLINWFIYSVQVWERGRFIDLVQRRIDEVDDPQVKIYLRGLVEELATLEYIIDVPKSAGESVK